jgi:flagellar protein FliO/FliZ
MKPLTLTRGAVLTGALTLARVQGALAASGENTPLHLTGTTVSTHTASSGGSGIVRTVVGLFIVIAVIYGVSWVLRQAKSAKNRASGRGLAQMATLPLGSGKSVALVRAGSEVVLIGIAENGITPIRTYTEEEAIQLGLEVSEDVETLDEDAGLRPLEPAVSFADRLRKLTVRS